MKHNIDKYNAAKRIDIDPAAIQALYASGMTLVEIAKHYGISVQPIKRIMKQNDIARRPAAQRSGRLAGSRHPGWAGGRRIRNDGYVILWTPEGERLEHRVIMERSLGRKLSATEIVHHKDGNPSNNDLRNLELLDSQRDHARNHGAANRRVLLRHGLKQCTLCKRVLSITQFYKTKHNRMGIQSWCKACKNNRDSQRRRCKQGR